MLSTIPIKLTLLLTTALLQTASPTSIPRQAACGTLPSPIPTPSISYLPDPFTNLAGQRITTSDQWTCRQQELSLLFQTMELGTLPLKPSSVTSSFSGNTLSITCSESGKSISFSVSITYPSTGTAPYPAIIAYGGGSIPIPAPAGVAMITYNNDQIAAQSDQSSRGQGLFYTLYGSTHSAGALIAWAWGVDRILDALTQTPSVRINPSSIGVTGCSRNGKGALVAGAFVPRIALTLPQESGSGGDASWRISDSIGSSTQTASEIVGENVWFSTAFNAWATRVSSLPFDHHLLAGLVSPRPLLAIENTDYVWLGPLSCYGAMSAAKLVYRAVGAEDRFGFSQVGGHSHCVFPGSQQQDLDAYVLRYLRNGTATTGVFRSTGGYGASFEEARWMPWAGSAPVLGGGGGTTSSSGTSAGMGTTTLPGGSSTTGTVIATPTANCQARWAQCGGMGYTGGTCCVSGTTCTVLNSYYSQCL